MTTKKRTKKRADMTAVRELALYADNDAQLYRQRLKPVQKNLVGKLARGVYNREKAVKLFRYYADAAAKKYQREFAGDAPTFSVADREAVARQQERMFFAGVKDHAFEDLVPKKYRKKGERCAVKKLARSYKLECGIVSAALRGRRRKR